MSFRVCIPTAGTGSRLLDLTRYLNKSLVSIANRPTLSHLIEQCPPDAEFVIALGHKGHLVRQFLELAYPQRTFFYAEVSPFEGPGSGLGLSLLACREYLQQPFVFMSCDTLVREAFPPPDGNWVAYAERDDLAAYRTVKVKDAQVLALCEKGEGRPDTHKAYIGLAGIHDYATFWQTMIAGGGEALACGEAYGLRPLVASGMAAHAFTWFDTGNPAALALAQSAYHEAGAPNILPKANEAIWFVGQQVIKFSDDENFIANRARRAEEIGQFVPKLIGQRKNMYCYSTVRGNVLSECVNLPLFEKLLSHCTAFWQVAQLDAVYHERFREQCMKFYRDKTLERVDMYYRNFGRHDGSGTINGIATPSLASLLDAVDWVALSNGLPGRFHGDFHFENILVSEPGSTFTFLDWRQDFGGSLSVGDIYYDLAKLLHGLIISHEIIARDLYWIAQREEAITFDFHRKQRLVDCEGRFLLWLTERGYDAEKVRLLTALIYLNIAALHHEPYAHLLYALGKSLLSDSLKRSGVAGCKR